MQYTNRFSNWFSTFRPTPKFFRLQLPKRPGKIRKLGVWVFLETTQWWFRQFLVGRFLRKVGTTSLLFMMITMMIDKSYEVMMFLYIISILLLTYFIVPSNSKRLITDKLSM
jgi:hypothetical protein